MAKTLRMIEDGDSNFMSGGSSVVIDPIRCLAPNGRLSFGTVGVDHMTQRRT